LKKKLYYGFSGSYVFSETTAGEIIAMERLASDLGLRYTRVVSDDKTEYRSPFPAFYYEDSEEHQRLVRAAEAHGVHLKVFRTEREWTHEELSAATLLRMGIPGPGIDEPLNASNGFDESTACRECGTGAMQTADLVINKRRMGKKLVDYTMRGHILISDAFRKAIHSEGLSGCEFRPVSNVRRGKDSLLPDLYQLVVTSELPPMAADVKFKRDPKVYCDVCSRNGLYIEDWEVHYRKRDLVVVSDFNRTLEWFGINRGGRVGYLLLVKPSVYLVCKREKIRNLHWDVIRVD